MLRIFAITFLCFSLFALEGCGSPRGPKYLDVRSFNEGLALAKAKNGKWGYINEKQSWAIRPQFDDAKSFKDGKAAVKKGGKWGFINKYGKWL